jgi:hypothetical protein
MMAALGLVIVLAWRPRELARPSGVGLLAAYALCVVVLVVA